MKTDGETARRRASLLEAFERQASRAGGFHALQGRSWGRRLRRALALKDRYFAYLVLRFIVPGPPKARVFWGKKYLWGSPENSTSMYLFGVLEHEAEVRLTRFLIRTLDEDDVFFDIGANFGFYSLLAAELVTAGRIVAFEPVPYVFESLKTNARAAGNVEAVDSAVSDREGLLDFDEAPASRHTGSSFSEESSRLPGAPHFEFKKIKVRSTTVDEFCARTKLVPTVIKVDVEGAEKLVIEGARRTLASASPTLIMEVWKPPTRNQNHRDAARLLEEAGYRPYSLTREGGLLALDTAALEREFSEGETANLVFRKS